MLPHLHYIPLTASTSVFPEICVYRFNICVDLCPAMACMVIMGDTLLTASWRKSWKDRPAISAFFKSLLPVRPARPIPSCQINNLPGRADRFLA